MRLLRKKQYNIPGEYARVSQWSKERDLLRIAHVTPINVLDTTALLKKMAARYGLPQLKITWRKGKCVGHGGIDKDFNPHITLPTSVYEPTFEHSPCERLRVGIILHEFAHILQYMKAINAFFEDGDVMPNENPYCYISRKVGGHGLNFVSIFDKLLLEWWRLDAPANLITRYKLTAAGAPSTKVDPVEYPLKVQP